MLVKQKENFFLGIKDLVIDVDVGPGPETSIAVRHVFGRKSYLERHPVSGFQRHPRIAKIVNFR
jgi:hypothetical protein